MTDPLQSMSHEVFVTYLSIPGLFTDEEIAQKLTSSYSAAGSAELLEVLQAISKAKAAQGQRIDGVLRTALRAVSGYDPLPGDPPLPAG